MNTYLCSKPSFTSPQPLAASSGLTIPLQITLSEIKLSAFIILVFSRQKGLTLVFRNDPLESIKVSSTFDSIPFVCEYLQKEIEIQLRTLMMEELPAIIHRLSLRLWCPEYAAREEEERLAEEKLKSEEIATDPLASPPQDAVDSQGNVLDASEISLLSLSGGMETHSLFSQKNLLHLGVLADSHRTLSLSTPSIRDAVFRAWAGPAERADGYPTSCVTPPTLTRSHSAVAHGGTTYTFSDHGGGADAASLSSRPSLTHLPSATTPAGGLPLGAGRRANGRRKKHRVVNLRKKALDNTDTMSEGGESATDTDASSSVVGGSEPIMATSRIPEETELELTTPPRSPVLAPAKVRFRERGDSIDLGETPRAASRQIPAVRVAEALVEAADEPVAVPQTQTRRPTLERATATATATATREKSPLPRTLPLQYTLPYDLSSSAPGGIVEQAWMMSMAAELARRAHLRKVGDEVAGVGGSMWGEGEGAPPPAYGV